MRTVPVCTVAAEPPSGTRGAPATSASEGAAASGGGQRGHLRAEPLAFVGLAGKWVGWVGWMG